MHTCPKCGSEMQIITWMATGVNIFYHCPNCEYSELDLPYLVDWG